MLGMPLPPCCRYHPAGVNNRINQLSATHAAFTLQLRARPPGILTFMDVCSLTGQVILSRGSQPVSTPLQDGLGFFHHPTPYLPQPALRLACPKGRRHGVTAFRVSDSKYLRSTLLCRWGCCPCRTFSNPSEPPTYRFGSSLTAPLACQYSRQLQVFTSVDHSILS